MPGIQCLALRRCDRERRHLTFREAEWFSVMDILPEEGVDLVGI